MSKVSTFTTIIEAIDADKSLSVEQKRELKSAVKRMADIVSSTGLDQAIDLTAIAVRLKSTSPAMAGMSRRSLSNLVSRFRRALKVAGIEFHPGKQTNELLGEWATLRELLSDERRWRGLSRLAHFASAQGWKPDDITDGHMDRFEHVLRHQALHPTAGDVIRKLRKSWSHCAQYTAGFPGKPVALPKPRSGYTIDPKDIPEHLKIEADAHFKFLENPPIFSIKGDRRPDGSMWRSPFRHPLRRALAPSTVAKQRFMFRQYLSALYRRGMPLAAMTSLAAVLQPEVIERGLMFFYERAGGKMTVQLGLIGLVLRSMAKYTLRDQELVTTITAMIKPTLGRRRMSSTVEARLRQLDDRVNRDRLLALPHQLVRDARRLLGGKPLKAARIYEAAISIEILIQIPLRIGNVVRLALDKHFVKSRPGSKGLVHLVIPAEEVKNRQPLEFEIPRELMRMIEEYRDKFRPHLPGADSKWLFPQEGGTPASYKNLGYRLCRAIYDRTGISMTSHMFRHFAAEQFLEAHPNGQVTTSRFLGHSGTDTADRYYVRRNTARAAELHHRNILRLRGRVQPPVKRDDRPGDDEQPF